VKVKFYLPMIMNAYDTSRQLIAYVTKDI